MGLTVAYLVVGCMKDSGTGLAQLVSKIETVEDWSRGPRWREHTAWLERSVAWDLVAAVTMTWAAHDVDESEIVDDLLRSGLAEIAAGPGDHVVSLVKHWRRALGNGGRCRIRAASSADVSWLRQRLSLPPPKGASPTSQRAISAYAQRAARTHDVQRVDCGTTAHLLVGTLADRFVPILRE